MKMSAEIVYFDGAGAVVEPNSPKVRGFRHETKFCQWKDGGVFSSLSTPPPKKPQSSGKDNRK